MAHDYNIRDDARRKLTDQVENFRTANDGAVAWNTEAPADFTFLFDPDHLLVRTRAEEAFAKAFEALKELVDGELTRVEEPAPGHLARYRLPGRREGVTVPDVVTALRRVGEFEPGDVTPDHWVHVAPGGGSLCPAIEPEETGLEEPWPPVSKVRRRKGCKPVQVSVVDTGWYPPAAANPSTPWMHDVDGDDEQDGPDLRAYAGHGTFIAGVVRCLAPHTEIYVEGFAVGGLGGGGLLESDVIKQMDEALDHDPQVINLSAGCRTHDDYPSLAFEVFHETRLKGRDCVLVAAAGNDSSPAPFWPAASPWSVGVGSLDRDGRVSSFSNHGVSADVYALGRNLVNAFPEGRFTCQEAPNEGDVRVFRTGMARWSGTSFSAPVVAGLIAREIYTSGSSAHDAAHAVLAASEYRSDPAVGPVQALRQPYDA